MKRWQKLVLAASAAAAFAAPGLAQQQPSQRDRWNAPLDAPFRIIGDLYYVGTGGLASYLLVTPQGSVLIDGALPESVPQIEANIARLGFKLKDVKLLLNTHAHYDHTGGLAQLKKDTGAQFIAMEGDVSALEGGFYLGSENVKAMGAPPIKVDMQLKDGDTLELGGHVLKANLTPGHTRGCTSWGLTEKDHGADYNVLIFCSATIAANRLVDPPQYEGIVNDYYATFSKAKQMKVDVFLAPHPEFFDMTGKLAKLKADPTKNPFIEPGEFGAFIIKAEADFEKGYAEQKAAALAKAAKAKPN